MATLYHKLKSESGASILLALAVMLVCAMVAAVVLMAASANAGTASGADARNRAFYSVSSAAQLLADDFAAESLRASADTVVRSYRCQDEHPGYVHDDAGVPVKDEVIVTSVNASGTPFIQVVEGLVRSIDPNDSSSSASATMTIHAPELDDVEAQVSMDWEYNISVKLRSIGDQGYSYALDLDIPALHDDPSESSTTDTSDIHMDAWEYTEEAAGLSWKETTTLNPATGSYEPLSNEYGSAVEQRYEVVTTTTTQFVRWGEASITKGEAA